MGKGGLYLCNLKCKPLLDSSAEKTIKLTEPAYSLLL